MIVSVRVGFFLCAQECTSQAEKKKQPEKPQKPLAVRISPPNRNNATKENNSENHMYPIVCDMFGFAVCAPHCSMCVCMHAVSRQRHAGAWAWQKTRKHNKWQYLVEKSNQTVFMYIVINEILHIKSVMTCFFLFSLCR